MTEAHSPARPTALFATIHSAADGQGGRMTCDWPLKRGPQPPVCPTAPPPRLPALTLDGQSGGQQDGRLASSWTCPCLLQPDESNHNAADDEEARFSKDFRRPNETSRAPRRTKTPTGRSDEVPFRGGEEN
ncbi:Hypothetical predicted protein [Cloeon dipterum]|uniref:Uncharacterized protein n=1 Tax=Cloeon dipterum TaxID=197152 RepID=A0A8S1BZU7_9INSE|nr:Hypothetical predicted protein [Cloeon dipterum]